MIFDNKGHLLFGLIGLIPPVNEDTNNNNKNYFQKFEPVHLSEALKVCNSWKQISILLAGRIEVSWSHLPLPLPSGFLIFTVLKFCFESNIFFKPKLPFVLFLMMQFLKVLEYNYLCSKH